MEPTAPAFTLGLKSGFFVAVGVAMVSVLTVLVGFTVVPLQAGHEIRDAARRLLVGVLSSFTLGFMSAAWAIKRWPWMREFYADLLPPEYAHLGSTLLASIPFLALTALVGFWVVAIIMHTVTRRKNKDVLQIVDELRGKRA